MTDARPTEDETPEDDHLDLNELVNELVLQDLEDLEKLFDAPIGKMLGEINTDDLTAATMTGIVWMHLKKTDPEITLEEAKKTKLRRLAAPEPESDPFVDDLVDGLGLVLSLIGRQQKDSLTEDELAELERLEAIVAGELAGRDSAPSPAPQ